MESPTQTLELAPWEQMQDAQATQLARFSVNCPASDQGNSWYSADENWAAVRCYQRPGQGLEVVNLQGKRFTLKFKNYLFATDVPDDQIPSEGGLTPMHWTGDEHFLYFSTDVGFDGGGTCFYGVGIQGLYRLDVVTGKVSTVLPFAETLMGYEVAFSPTDRRLAYQGTGDLIVLDLQTGQEIALKRGTGTIGDLRWSPDGSELAYAVCDVKPQGNDYVVKNSAINIYSVSQQSTRTLLSALDNQLTVERWDANDILEIGNQDPTGNTNYTLFNLTSGQWTTATPQP